MITHNEYLSALQIIKDYRAQCLESVKEIDSVLDDKEKLRKEFIKDNLSQRALSAIINLDLDYGGAIIVEDLEFVSKSKLKKVRNFGIKSLREITDLCERADIKLLP